MLAIDDAEPCRVHTENGACVTADRVILATNAPLNKVLLQTKIAHYRSYAVSGPVATAPHGLFWDLDDPYHYIRNHRFDDVLHLIVGGEDHKTGQKADTEGSFERLSSYAKRFGLTSIASRWSGQIIEPVDGLPYIGLNAASHRTYVATGYSGNGMTFGTLAAMILSDACLGRKNPFAELYDATRFKPLASLSSYISENLDFPMHLIRDAIKPPEVRSIDEIKPGEGAIARVGKERLAVYRREDGAVVALSPICTHLGCHVSFNKAEKTWDCPCHGSRFNTQGEVVNGPAVKALRRRNIRHQ